MPPTEDVADLDFFELMIARFTPNPQVSEWRINTVRELDECLAGLLTEPLLAVGLGCVAEGADWGSFLLLLHRERGWVHLMEGACLTARDPSLTGPNGVVRFQDDAGVWHEVAFEETISREQGLQALRHWLPRGDKLPELRWVKAASGGAVGTRAGKGIDTSRLGSETDQTGN
jgi:hypothetical protein